MWSQTALHQIYLCQPKSLQRPPRSGFCRWGVNLTGIQNNLRVTSKARRLVQVKERRDGQD